jgi:hypothetical protein
VINLGLLAVNLWGVQIILSWAHARALTSVDGFTSRSLNIAIYGHPQLEWLSTDAVLRKRFAKEHCSVDISKQRSSTHTHAHTHAHARTRTHREQQSLYDEHGLDEHE